jgi:hypothetical protein
LHPSRALSDQGIKINTFVDILIDSVLTEMLEQRISNGSEVKGQSDSFRKKREFILI